MKSLLGRLIQAGPTGGSRLKGLFNKPLIHDVSVDELRCDPVAYAGQAFAAAPVSQFPMVAIFRMYEQDRTAACSAFERWMTTAKNLAKRVLGPRMWGWMRERRERLAEAGDLYSVNKQFSASNGSVVCAPRFHAHKRTPTILFLPDRPRYRSVEFKLCSLLGYAISRDSLAGFDVVFQRRCNTFFDSAGRERLFSSLPPPINGGVSDISKRKLSTAFRDTFGYDLSVDPSSFEGSMVEKSDINARHDGRVLQGPISQEAIRPDCVYQKVVDNTLDPSGESIVDLRVPLHGGQIPLVYVKHRPMAQRFSNINAFVELGDPEALFSPEEREVLRVLALKMGADYCEMDVLRDRERGLLYVVDMNTTPYGPPNGLSMDLSRRALHLLCGSFAALIESRC